MRCLLDRVENVVGNSKGENAIYQHFLLVPQIFQRAFFFRVVKSWDCVEKGFKDPKKEDFFETLREMEENPGNQIFSTQ